MNLLLALALASSEPVIPAPGTEEYRKLLCSGPTENIPDDDPGLVLFLEVEPDDLEARKVALAIERVNSCYERLSAMPLAERLAIAERLLCPNGVNDWTEEGPSCD